MREVCGISKTMRPSQPLGDSLAAACRAQRQDPSKERRMKTSDQYYKCIDSSEDDQTYIGKCPDLLTGIHGDDPVRLYRELCDVIDDVIHHFAAEGRPLPCPRIRPMQEVV